MEVLDVVSGSRFYGPAPSGKNSVPAWDKVRRLREAWTRHPLMHHRRIVAVHEAGHAVTLLAIADEVIEVG